MSQHIALRMSADAKILAELLELASRYAAQQARPDDRVHCDLNINGGDFLEFVVDVEGRYGVDLSWVSPHDPRAEASDPTIQSLANDVVAQRA